MRIENDVKLDYQDVLIRPKRSTIESRSDVVLEKKYSFRNSGATYIGVPIMASNMVGVGTIGMAKAFHKHKMFVCLNKDENYDEIDDVGLYFNIAVTSGISAKEHNELYPKLTHYPFRYLMLDVANGYMEKFVAAVKYWREEFPDITIIAGNVVTGEMTEELILAGADIIKVGIGSGAQCTTRLIAGVGYPQLSAVDECADAAHGLKGHIIADGGIVHYGDVAKAFGAGADFVMMGTMFAGTYEGIETELIDGKYPDEVLFYGNSSTHAQLKKYANEKSGKLFVYKTSEGRATSIKTKGSVEPIIESIFGGLRSACSYAGARTLKDLPRCASFIKVNRTHNNSHEHVTIGN